MSVSYNITKTSGQSLHFQLRETLRALIADGQFAIGDRIPSETELCQKYNVSRTTVRTAIDDLVDYGYLVKIHGKGTFVAGPKVRRDAGRLTGFSEDVRRLGKEVDTKVLDIHLESPPRWVADAFNLGEQGQVVMLSRLRLLNNVPVGINKSYISPHLNVQPEQLRQVSSLYSFLEQQQGIRLFRAEDLLTAERCSSELAKLLNMRSGEPILVVRRTIYDPAQVAIECAEGIYSGDRYEHLVVSMR